MTSLKEYEMLGEIGRGAFGIVHKVRHRQNKQVYVLKQVDLSQMNARSKRQAQDEANILKDLRSPYVVRYYFSFMEKGRLHIVMEFCAGGDLQRYLKRMAGRPLKEQLIWKFFVQMCVGLRDIHHKRILHRDIKAMNIFLTQDENIRIGDLGVAKEMKQDFARTVVGTPYYLSPEMCEEKPYNEKTDIWALGCVLYQLCTGHYPFEAQNLPALTLNIIRGKYKPISSHYSLELSETIRQCLSVDHKRRPSASHILERPFIREFIKSKGIETSADRHFEHEKPTVVGNTVPLKARQTTPPKTHAITPEQNFKPAKDIAEKPNRASEPDMIQSIKVGKWSKPKKSQPEVEQVPQFLKKRLEEQANVEQPQSEMKKVSEHVPAKVDAPIVEVIKSPSTKNIPKSAQNFMKHPVKNPIEERRIKDEQRKEEHRLEVERYEQKMKEFQKKKDEEKRERVRLAEQKKKEQEERLREIKLNKLKQPKESPIREKEESEETTTTHDKSSRQKGSHSNKQIPTANPKQKQGSPTHPQYDDGNVIPDGPDSDNEHEHKPDKLRQVVHLVQQKVDDDEVWDDFGIVGHQAKLEVREKVGTSLDLVDPNELKWEENKTADSTKSGLPTFEEESEPQLAQTVVCQYDPNEIMEQLEEVQPYQQSSVDEEIEEENVYLVDESTGKDRQNLERMLEENNKRKENLLVLTKQKQEQLFTKLPHEQYSRLKQIVREGEDNIVQQAFLKVKAFQDPKVLHLFYKILLFDSQIDVCDRTIKQIQKKLATYK